MSRDNHTESNARFFGFAIHHIIPVSFAKGEHPARPILELMGFDVEARDNKIGLFTGAGFFQVVSILPESLQNVFLNSKMGVNLHKDFHNQYNDFFEKKFTAIALSPVYTSHISDPAEKLAYANKQRADAGKVLFQFMADISTGKYQPSGNSPGIVVQDGHFNVKWSGKTGQSAKVYPTLENGYANDDETPIFR